MSEPKLISPLLDNYIMGDPISEKPGVCCCPALERDTQNKCIVKIISTPASQSQLDALLLSGAYPNAQDALQYFRSIADGILDETKVLQRLSQLEGFFPYIDCQLVPMTDGVGFDVYALSEYRKTLSKLLRSDNLTHLAAVNLALDICTALAVCRRIGYLYVNLKPDNIYFSDNGTWKIGDIGFIRLDSLKYASLPERYRSEYTAPEINDAFASLNTTLDVYSLGLVLYKIYNANQMPANLGNAEGAPLLPPDYADYEMSEIILKACDPDPEKRWQDPIEMGQALVSYMQRNGVNDEPIIPAPVAVSPAQPVSMEVESDAQPLEEISDAAETPDENTEIVSADEIPESATDTAASDPEQQVDTENVAVLLTPSNDETAPEQNEDQLENISVSDEVSAMLSQADDLISHPTPDITTLEEEISDEDAPLTPDADQEVTDPQPIDSEEIKEPDPEEVVSEDTSTGVEAEEPIPDNSVEDHDEETPGAENAEAVIAENEAESNEPEQQPETLENIPTEDVLVAITDETDDEIIPTEQEEPITPDEKKNSHWLRNLLIATALVILALLAFLFYTKYYRQSIDALSVVKSSGGEVTVNLSTQIDESKLSVVCSDAYGNTITAGVNDGSAVFENLKPGTAYTVKVQIEGFHGLVGKTESAFTIPALMEILQFNAVTGSEDGSAVLSFITQNQDSENWTVTYTADDGNQVVESFKGHKHTILNLTIGNTYTFLLTPEEDIEYVGTTEITHTAAAVIEPEDLHIVGIADGKLTAAWSSPEGVTVNQWTVHCYGDKGFDQTVVVDTPSAIIDGIDVTEGYTIEVAAAGMSKTALVIIPANATAVTDFNITVNNKDLAISWKSADDVTTDWILSYSVDGFQSQEIACSENSFVLENLIPASTYTFQLKCADGTAVLGGRSSFTTAEAEKFSGYHVKASDMHFYSCRTPNKSNWSKKDLAASDYTSSFRSGERISFLVEVKVTYNPSKDPITTLFVIRNEEGQIVDFSTSTKTWTQMWYKGLCELDVPSVPEAPGKYTISIYMNGKFTSENPIVIK